MIDEDRTERAPLGYVPPEVASFLSVLDGRSLVVKGPAGTGKTTLVLQLLETLGRQDSSLYLPTRVPESALPEQFSGLKDVIRRTTPGEGMKLRPSRSAPRTKLKELEGLVEVADVDLEDESQPFEPPRILEPLEMVWDFVDENMKALVVVDSIDALHEQLGIANSRLMNTFQGDLVDSGSTNMVYVLEKSGETALDYLGDGVVSLASTEHRGRRLRVLTIEKLRGQEIRLHKYLYTLSGGHFTVFGTTENSKPAKPKEWQHQPDSGKDIVGTGMRSLDGVVGGLSRGTISVFKISDEVPTEYVDALRLSMICNFASGGRGVAHVAPGKGTTEQLRGLVGPHMSPNAFEKHIHVFEAAAPESRDLAKNATFMEGKLKWADIEYHLSQSRRPFLALVAFDTLEAAFGGQSLDAISHILSSIRRSGDIFVGLMSPESSQAAKLVSLAKIVLTMESVDGCVILYGDKPHTGLFHLSFDWSAGIPNARLQPIV